MDIDELCEEITEAFKGVTRGSGVSLHETPVIDAHGSERERTEARKKDIDTDWTEVKDEWVEENSGVGGIHFLDGPGLRYYLPAYMLWFLRKGKSADFLVGDSLSIFLILYAP